MQQCQRGYDCFSHRWRLVSTEKNRHFDNLSSLAAPWVANLLQQLMVPSITTSLSNWRPFAMILFRHRTPICVNQDVNFNRNCFEISMIYFLERQPSGNTCLSDAKSMVSMKWKCFPRYRPFVRGTTGNRWILFTMTSDAELRYFLWSSPELTFEQTVELSVIWDATAAVWRWCNSGGLHVMISPTIPLFVQTLAQVNFKENIEASRHRSLWRESTGHRWFPSQMVSNAENIFISWRHHGSTEEFTHKGPVMCSLGVSFYVKLNKLLNKQPDCRWFETPWLTWHHCYAWLRYNCEKYALLRHSDTSRTKNTELFRLFISQTR